MLAKRVIPTLLISDSGLVKTRKFSNPKYIGDPINTIKIFNDKEVDEIIVLDIDATRRNREPDYELISNMAGECFMPLCYGGGITSIEQARKIFRLGVEKISIQSEFLKDLDFLKTLTAEFGSQSIVVSIDFKTNWFKSRAMYNRNKKASYKGGWEQFVLDIEMAGAGEILINSIDCDGMMKGMDYALIKDVAKLTSLPLIAAGGVGSLSDIRAAIESGADAVAVGSYFVFHGAHKAVLITYPQYQDLVELLEGL